MKRKKYTLLNNLFFFYGHLYRYDKGVIYKQILHIISAILLPVFSIYLPKVMLDCIEKKVTAGYLWGVLGSFVVVIAVFAGANAGLDSGTYMDRNFFRNFLIADLFKKFRKVPYRYTEEGTWLNLYNGGWRNIASGGDWSAASRFFSETPAFIIRFCCFFVYSTVIGTVRPQILLFLIVLVAAKFGLKEWDRKYQDTQRPVQDNLFRKIRYIKNISENPAAAKDIRIFGLRSWLSGEMETLFLRKKQIESGIANRSILQQSGGHLLDLIRDAAVYGWLVAQTVKGQFSAGDFVLYLGAVNGFGSFLNDMVYSIQELRLASDKAQNFRQYLDLADEEEQEKGDKERKDLPDKLSIDFENVTFSYEENGEKVLSNFTLHISPGERIALVGENGAGKSTFVKLLTGMYQPQEGCIRIGGVDIRDLKVKERYRLFSAVFQETAYFPFTVGENLTLQPIDKVDQKRAWCALDQAGLGEKFRNRGITLNDYMTKYYLQNGIELSGGEMQRFMMARALYKDGPILVLDEPTAALDPIAESEVYQAYAEMTREKTAIFISHRLASTRFSDRIVLLRNGMIAESGTHEELIALGGEYAAMFALQASYYRENTKEEVQNGNKR